MSIAGARFARLYLQRVLTLARYEGSYLFRCGKHLVPGRVQKQEEKVKREERRTGVEGEAAGGSWGASQCIHCTIYCTASWHEGTYPVAPERSQII